MGIENNVKLHFYSERGIVNSVIFWMSNAPKEEIIKLLKGIKDKKGDSIVENYKKIDIFDEFSFGDFGSPDLIIKVKSKEKTYVFIIEAKITTYDNASIDNDNNGSIVYKNNASKLNIQLSLRKRFIDSIESIKGEILDGIEVEPANQYDYTRKLKKTEVLKWIKNHIKGDFKYYFISLTTDKANHNPFSNESRRPLDYEKEDSNYGYWLYEDIEEVIGEFEPYDNAWEYTNGFKKDFMIIHNETDKIKKSIEDLRKYKRFSDFTIPDNKSAITIKKGTAIFRIWATNKDFFAVEIIDDEAFKQYFSMEYSDYQDGYYLINKLNDIKKVNECPTSQEN